MATHPTCHCDLLLGIKLLKVIIIIFASFSLLVLSLILWSASPFLVPGIRVGIVKRTASLPSPKRASNHLTLLTWNLGFLYGIGSEGPGYKPRSREYFYKRLKQVAALLDKHKVDVAIFQEVEFGSARGHDLDFGQALAQHSELSYRFAGVSWELNYLPFPYLPVSYQFGKTKSGGLILSRYPLQDPSIELFEKPASNAFWYNWFYLFRYRQMASFQWRGRKLSIVNVHLEAFDKKKRARELKQLSVNLPEGHLLLGGDFNTSLCSKEAKVLFRSEPRLKFGGNCRDMRPTFPSNRPSETLDGWLLDNGFRIKSYKVMNTGNLSDHFPVLIEIT